MDDEVSLQLLKARNHAYIKAHKNIEEEDNRKLTQKQREIEELTFKLNHVENERNRWKERYTKFQNE